MDLTQLRYFRAVVQAGSLTQAARRLGISQPSLSVAIKKLEQELNTTLLLRNARGVEPTSTGLELILHTQQAFDVLDKARDRISGLENQEMGNFRIGCHESLGAYFLPGFLYDFLQEAPGIEVTLFNATSAEVRRAVIERQIHFALVVNPLAHPDLVCVDLFEDQVAIFAPAEDIDGMSTPPSQAELQALMQKKPIIYAGRVMQSHQILTGLSDRKLLPSRMLDCGDLEMVKSLTLGGVGLGILPARVAAYGHGGKIRLIHPELPHFDDKISLLYRGDMHRTRAALKLKNALVYYGKNRMN